MQKYFFSVIIPTLNEEVLITRILEQLKNQTFKNFELINVDANSEDATVNLIKKFQKNFDIKYLNSTKRNVCYQKNLGAKSSDAEWLVFMDADNQIENNFLEQVKNEISKNNKLIVGFTTFFKPDKNKFVYQMISFFLNWVSLFSLTTNKPFVTESLFIFNKEIFLKIRGFDENIKVAEGAELVNRLKKYNLSFKLLKNPKYINSMRRLEKNGALNTIWSNMKIGYYMFLKGEKTDDKKFSQMYKMEGGKSHLN